MNTTPAFMEENGRPFVAPAPFAFTPATPAAQTVALDPGLSLQIGARSYIHDQRIRNPSGALTRVTIGNFCSIATDLTIIGYDHHSEWITMFPFLDDGNRALWPGTSGLPYPGEPQHGSNRNRGDITIGNDVWIGYGVKLFKGISIGNGAVIGACSLVNKSVEPYTIVAGIPARPIRKRFSESEIAVLQKIKWWDWPEDRINRYMQYLCSARIAELEKLLEQDPVLLPAEALARAEQYLAQADAAYARSDLPAARDALKLALQSSPGSLPLLTCLGNVQFQLAEFEDAVRSFKRAAELKPEDSDILIRLANAAARSNQAELCEQSSRRALQLDPRNPHALLLAAHDSLRRKRYPDAATHFCALLATQPDDAGLLLPLGQCLRELEDNASARWCCERVLQLDPANAAARETLQSLSPPAPRFRVAAAVEPTGFPNAH